MLLFAETSMNGMPSSSANCCPRSTDTARFSSQSHLLPIRILLTPSVACCSTFENQVRISSVCQLSAAPRIWCRGGHTVKRALVSDIIYQQYTHSTSVICRRDCPESFLPRGVPYLQLDPLAVQLDRSDLEVNTYRCDE